MNLSINHLEFPQEIVEIKEGSSDVYKQAIAADKAYKNFCEICGKDSVHLVEEIIGGENATEVRSPRQRVEEARKEGKTELFVIRTYKEEKNSFRVGDEEDGGMAQHEANKKKLDQASGEDQLY